MDRRFFLKQVGAGLALGGTGAACAREGSRSRQKKSDGFSRVAVLTDASVRKDGGFDDSRVRGLLAGTLVAALAAKDAQSGLRSLFSADDVVGIKLNCLAGPPLSPSREFCSALVGLLNAAGVSSERIVFFERGERDLRKGGFSVGAPKAGPAYMGNDSPGAGYERELSISGQVGSCLSRILTRRITALINVGVLKDHNLAGVGAGMKNLFGLIHNPNKFHDHNCDPFVADVLAFPVIQKKLRLTLLDAITAQCQGGPGYMPAHAWPFNGMLASTDPVALDSIAWDLLESQRKAQGMPTLAVENRAPKWIRTAALRGLGTDDRSRIRVIKKG